MSNLDENKREEYYDKLLRHLEYVKEAGKMIGLSATRYLLHDESKFHPIERHAFEAWYSGDISNPQAYDRAMLHHIHNNPHHYHYWIMPTGFTPKGDHDNGCLEMPRVYILEMMANWMAANKENRGDFDMTDWLRENLSKIQLHGRSMCYLLDKLRELGYNEVINEIFGMELENKNY